MMDGEIETLTSAPESRPVHMARALTWLSLLTGALLFWVLVVWIVWGYLRP